MSHKERLSSFQEGAPSRRFSAAGAGYSFFVRFSRIALPVIALIILGVVISRLSQVGPQLADVPQDEKTTTGHIDLITPKYEGVDEEGRPYTVTATKASRAPELPNTILLENPKGDITTKDGAWIIAEGATGTYDTESARLFLQKDVKLFHDAGYEAWLENLDINTKSHEALSTAPLKAQGPMGELYAQNMHTEDGGMRVIFGGPAKLILFNLKGGRG